MWERLTRNQVRAPDALVDAGFHEQAERAGEIAPAGFAGCVDSFLRCSDWFRVAQQGESEFICKQLRVSATVCFFTKIEA